MTSWKNKLLIIGFYVSVLYSPVTGQNEGLYIYPKDEKFYVGSDVTVKCKFRNETHNQLVATNWTDWYTGSVLTAEEEYMKTNVNKGYHLIVCRYNNLSNRTTLRVEEPDIRPVVNCTSLSEFTCQCKWNIVNGVHYTYEIRTHGTIPWTLQIPQTHSGIASTSVIEAKLYQDNLQDIRVNATKDISSASWITTHDIMRKLKPNITYKESTMTATSATIKWRGNSKPEYWEFLSQFKYEECDGETNETFRMLPDQIDVNSLITKTIDDLKPYRFYKFGIRSRYTRPGNGYTGWTYVVLRTNESRPSKEVQFEIESQEDDTLLKWNDVPKESQNGKILGYTIYVNSESYDVDVNNTEYSLKGIGGGNYNVCITASNSAGESPINCQPVNLTTQMELSSTKPHEGISNYNINL
ncbi:leukemia inhibitory factor receptor-like isoform X2 [Anneissia japonica]|uniref:leukemia inhibitory factor receptor-like isoform X2 n=1 Tax=Anneissia japonica TaxID=1529436 RepID=UPI0014259438|nr:leukemia inhibitory factor receptor-like isoform X2 [Anneissia japonica]